MPQTDVSDFSAKRFEEADNSGVTGNLPDFLVIGAQKAGTTWLRYMLRQHPGVFMSDTEIHFFNKLHNYSRGVGWYSRHFSGAAPHHSRGEKTPNYLWVNARPGGSDLPDSHERIAAVVPSVKLIAVLRDPVERAIAAFNHHLCKGRLPPHATMEDVLFGRHSDRAEYLGILSMGMYHTQLSSYLRVFDREQLLVLIFEDEVVRDPISGLRRVCHFLGIDPAFEFQGAFDPRNRKRESRSQIWANYLLPDTMARQLRPVLSLSGNSQKQRGGAGCRSRLRDLYEDEVCRLRSLLGRELSSWKLGLDVA